MASEAEVPLLASAPSLPDGALIALPRPEEKGEGRRRLQISDSLFVATFIYLRDLHPNKKKAKNALFFFHLFLGGGEREGEIRTEGEHCLPFASLIYFANLH